MRGNKRYKFSETKTVTTKMKERLFIIEGSQVVLINNLQPSQPIELFAILSYDEKGRVYKFRTHLASGFTGDHSATLTNGIIEWLYNDATRGQSRYQIREDEQGRWVETGETTQDGKVWQKFYENILTRIE